MNYTLLDFRFWIDGGYCFGEAGKSVYTGNQNIINYGITPSMSRRGNPYDNALAEKFFSILKTECIYRAKLRTYEEARLLIGEYIHFYNNERIQLKTKLTPLEKRSQYVA